MASLLDIDAFVARSRECAVLDVRTPSEFADGHFPDALNLPLFSDEERAEVGTAYHQESREAAMRRGLEAVGPKLSSLVTQAHAQIPDGNALTYCWRGGMRSEALAWLLDFAGFKIARLEGGYKAFRSYVLDAFALTRNVRIISGKTGSGKTEILNYLAERGEQVINLEGLARHKGSVFGGLDEPEQPRQQQFENELALQWRALDPERVVWLEDESRRIGGINLPKGLWEQMRAAPAYVILPTDEARIQRLVAMYGETHPDALKHAIKLVEKRLGGQRTKKALQAVNAGNLAEACHLLLHYYDRAYLHGLSRRNKANIIHLPEESNTRAITDRLLKSY